jgi:peptide/nickel transport system permease protein
MARYVLSRLAASVPLLLVVSMLAFLLLRAGGDPMSAYLSSTNLPPEAIERIRREYGLDQPLPVQYLSWLGGIFRGDWGYSFATRQPVTTMIGERVTNSLLLMTASLAVTILLAIPLGVLAAVKRRSKLDYTLGIVTTVAFATPSFWLGILAILLFAILFKEWGLPSLPAGGMYDLNEGRTLLGTLRHMILPVAILSLVSLAAYTRYLRAAVLEVLSQDYVRTARAKGLAERVVLLGHVLKNAAIPLVTLIVLDIPRIFSGALITEQVFAWPGMGRLFVEHAARGDYPVLMGIVLIVSVLVAVMSVLGDVVYGALDPTIRLR